MSEQPPARNRARENTSALWAAFRHTRRVAVVRDWAVRNSTILFYLREDEDGELGLRMGELMVRRQGRPDE